MNDHDTDRRLRSWARSGIDPSAPDDLRRKVLDIPTSESKNHRRRRLWVLPGSKPTAGAENHDKPDRLITTDHHNGGTRSMFSATKFVAIAASVALFGALTLALPLSPPQDTQAPAAEAQGIDAVTSFTGGIQLLGQDRTGSAEEYDWGSSTGGEQWTFRLRTSDPRYSGLGTSFHNVYEVGPDETAFRVQTGRLFTENEDGTWLSKGYSYQDPETTGITWVTNSTGEGAYAGLSAYSICEQVAHARDMECHGIVFEGEWPEFPSEAPTEYHAAYGAP